MSIADKLVDLENRYNIEILYACEAGSRVWGFASPNSDYDIRFIYRYPLEQYLKLDTPRETIDYIEEDYDYAGWDIRKALHLLRKTNAALLEWLDSPICYQNKDNLQEELASLAIHHHPSAAIYWHYLKMAENNYHQIIQEPTTQSELALAKKYLYVANSLIKALYYETHNEFPPLDFIKALNDSPVPDHILQRMQKLVSIKKRGIEPEGSSSDTILNEWMENELKRLSNKKIASKRNADRIDILDDLFLRIVKKE
jgi:predicted nucleotidyltransferase